MQHPAIVRRVALAIAVVAGAAGAAGATLAANCKPCSNDLDCCRGNYLSAVKSCCWAYGPCNNKGTGGAGEQPVSRAPGAENACYDGAKTVLDKCLAIVDPTPAHCRQPGSPGEGKQQHHLAAGKEPGYPYGSTIVWPLMRLERTMLSRGSWAYIVDVPEDVRATLVLLNGVPRHDDETGKLRPDLPPERRGVDGTVELDGERIVSMPALSGAALRRVPLELSAGRHRITFDLRIDRVEDDLAILAAYLEFD